MSHESGGNANAANYNTDSSFDVGLWQVNSFNWNSWYVSIYFLVLFTSDTICSSGGNAPCDPNANLQCAIDVWKWGGGNFRFWSTCGGCGCC